MRVLAGLTATSLIGAAWWHDEWSPLLRALVGAAVVALVLGALWLALPGAIAFGDVKVTVVAFAAAAAVSWRAGAVMIVLACVIGGCVAVIARGLVGTSRQRSRPFRSCRASRSASSWG